MDSLYHIIINIGILATSPFVLVKMVFNRAFREDLRQRLLTHREMGVQRGCLWVHASSVGEVRAAQILIQAMKDRGEPRPILLSTFTRSGYELAKKAGIDPVFRLPPDSPFWLDPLLDKLDPALLILIEAEFWPGLLSLCRQRNIPVLLVNGRMSAKSLHRYGRIKKIFRWITGGVRLFSMRSPVDAARLLELGAPKERVLVTGNIKFDAPAPDDGSPAAADRSGKPATLVFGSTRPGDEGPVMEAILKLREEIPELNCVIAPRHVERCKEIENLIRDYGLDFKLHSQLAENPADDNGSLILVDSHGQLNHYYAGATVAFVGGGFNPRFGGHNILEPAMFGVPVVFGKHMNNFEEEAQLLIESEGGIQIEGPGHLVTTLKRLLSDPEERKRRGNAAKTTVEQNRGSLEKNIELINKILSPIE